MFPRLRFGQANVITNTSDKIVIRVDNTDGQNSLDLVKRSRDLNSLLDGDIVTFNLIDGRIPLSSLFSLEGFINNLRELAGHIPPGEEKNSFLTAINQTFNGVIEKLSRRVASPSDRGWNRYED